MLNKGKSMNVCHGGSAKLMLSNSEETRISSFSEDLWPVDADFSRSRSQLIGGRLSAPGTRTEPSLQVVTWDEIGSLPESIFGIDYGEEKIFTIVPDGKVSGQLDLDALFVRKRTSKLLVMLHGALDRDVFTLPRMEYRRTLRDFDGSVLFIQDPTLYSHDKLTLGWYIGTQYDNGHEMLVHLIRSAMAVVDPKRLVIAGSSGGGFAALAVSARLPESSALVFSPQTSVENYHVHHRRRLISAAFPDLKPTTDTLIPLQERLDMGSLYSKGTSNQVYYLQNTGDPFHIRYHLWPFMKHAGLDLGRGEMRNHRIKVECRYLREGHGGPRPNQLRLYINRVFDGGF